MILDAAAQWRDKCLLGNGSVFSERHLWIRPLLDELETYYVDRLDFGEGDFLEKFRQQLEPCSPDAKRLAAEMLWVMFLFPSNIGSARKIEIICTIWGWSGEDLSPDHPLFGALAEGIGSGGPGYNNYRWLEVVVFIRWLQAWKDLDESSRATMLGDPWRFAGWLDSVPGAAKRQLRHMILHLLFPDTFERVSSADNKRLIERAFRDRLSSTDLSQDDLEPTLGGQDRRLLRIRQILESENPNQHVDFYEGEFLTHWRDGLRRRVAEQPEDPDETQAGRVLPPSSRERIIDALNKFDSELRENGEWSGWERNAAHLYAISNSGKLYPVKQIISMVTGVPRIEFFGGEPANRYVRQYGFEIVRLHETEVGKAWIFQANADRYDVQAALKTLRQMHWLVQQHKSEIHAGDRVFLWQSGSKGGIVAEARVLTDPSFLEQSAEEAKYWKNAADSGTSNQLRVRIAIDKVVSPPLDRQTIQGNSELSNLSILKFSQGTNFPVTDREAAILGVMLQARQTQPRPDAAYWCIAPGEGARLWNDFVESGIAAIGWDQLGDLTNFGSKEDVIAALKNEKSGEGEPTNDALACYQFANNIRVGDVIIAKRGIKEVVGYGIVTSNYEFRSDRAEYRHVRQVNWIAIGPWLLPPDIKLPLKTLTDVSTYDRFLSWLLPLLRGEADRLDATSTVAPFSVDDALAELFTDRDSFVALLDTLGRKRNIILQGPPGVGKTFAAKRIAYALMREQDKSRVEMVQFHQSYAYEDFIQGWRPTQNGFELRNGVFYNFAKKASADSPDRPYVFIIDEINRANLSKVLGELMMLIETDKRGPENAMPLTYAAEGAPRFFVPSNLYIIGLMNTADRSLAMVDYALRRRFAFVDLEPAFKNDRFSVFLKSKGASPDLIALIVAKMTRLNESITRDSKNLGHGFEIGHSYFCPADTEAQLDQSWYKHIIDSEVKPLLREYWFDDRGKADQWAADLLP
jgi:MoxR-like ATPase